jgi:hypothetical protein
MKSPILRRIRREESEIKVEAAPRTPIEIADTPGPTAY